MTDEGFLGSGVGEPSTGTGEDLFESSVCGAFMVLGGEQAVKDNPDEVDASVNGGAVLIESTKEFVQWHAPVARWRSAAAAVCIAVD